MSTALKKLEKERDLFFAGLARFLIGWELVS